MSGREKVLLTSASCVFQKKSDSMEWFLVKDESTDEWQMPKTVVRSGESSVRAAIRSMAEEGGMRAKILEEVGRAGGAGKQGDKIVTTRTIYYLMSFREGGEALGFAEYGWFEHSSALRKIASKRDKQMLKDAKLLVGRLEKEKGKKFKTGAAAIKEETADA